VFGKASGFASSLQLSSLDGANGFRLEGVAGYDRSGRSVAAAGDVNGDGFADLIVGAYRADPNGGDSGSSYVVFGRAPDAAVNRLGAAGRQYISGGAFNDTLSGLDGNDRLEGRGGADALDGGAGLDVASYAHAAGAVQIDLTAPANNTGDAADDSYAAIEGFALSSFDDIFTGAGGNDRVSGRGGTDILKGAGGNDILTGGIGADLLAGEADIDLAAYGSARSGIVADLQGTLANTGDALGDVYIQIENLAGSRFADTLAGDTLGNQLIGGKGDDLLLGRDGDDVVLGGSGADTLDGGAGRDRLIGGADADVFDFNAIADSSPARGLADVVRDFSAASDRIDVQDIDASAAGPSNEDFTFLNPAGAAFTAEGQIRWYQRNGFTFIELNTAGTTGAEMTITLIGTISLTAGDFNL
jgi:Ca2+-binding RTX toxin-like protein